MKTVLPLIFAFLLPLSGFSQSDLVKWTGIINNQPSNAPTVVANYVAADNFTASSNVNLNTNWQGFETSGWGDAAAVANYAKYYQMSVRPTSGASMTVTKIRFKYQGEYRKFEVRYAKNAEFSGSVSLDITNPAQFYNTGTQKDLNVNIPVLAGERLYIRIYVFDKVGGTTWKILHSSGDHVPPTIVGTVTTPQPLAGTYTIGQALTNDYKTITDAASAVNSIGVQGPVTFLLNDAEYNNTLGENFPITFNQITGSSAVNTITIRPNTGVNARIDAYNANGNVPVHAVFKMNGADNIIIDGSNVAGGISKNLTIDNNSQLTYTNRSVIYLVNPGSSNAAENVTVKNAYLQQSYTNGDSQYTIGVYAGADTAANSSLTIGQSAGKIKNLTVSNITFLNVKEGVYILDGSAVSPALQNVVVEKSRFGGTTNEEKTITAIYMSNVNGFTIDKNNITGVYRNHNNGDLGFAGIQIAGVSTNGTIAANNISQVEKTVANGAGIAGINLSSVSANANITLLNNIVQDVTGPGNGGENQNGFGIGIFSGSGYKLYHNTVRLTKNQYNNAGISAALFIENNVLNLDIRNNMFINTQPSNSARFAIYVATAGQSTFAALDNNNYYSADKMGSIGSFYQTANIKTFQQWKAATGKDGASMTIMPTFVSSSDAHLASFAVGNMGITGQVLGIAADIDGDTRNLSTPYVGADEFGSTGCQYVTTYNPDGTWSNGLPDNSKAVIINGVYIPTTDVEACSLTITATGSLVMPVRKNLFVVNQIDIMQGGVLEMASNSDIIQMNDVSNTGTATIKRNSSLIKWLDYTMWSSPVTGTQTLLQFSPMTLTNRFYTYSTHTNLYVSIASPETTTFALAKGYLIRSPNNHPEVPTVINGVFSGTLNNGTITFPMVYEGPSNGYNAVGNPYPSPINVSEFIDANIDNIQGTLWFWRKTNDNTKSSYSILTKFAYAANNAPGGENEYAVDPHGVLNTGQGFIVKAKNVANLVFTNQMRKVNSSDQFFRTMNNNEEAAPEAEASRIWLNITNDGDVFTQAVIGYTAEATLDIDNGIDGESFVDGDTNLYSIVAEKTLAIQGRPAFTAEDVVPMGFTTTAAGTFVLSIDHMDGIFLGDQAIFVKDNLTGTTHNLKDSNYIFSSQAGVFDTRFEIVYAEEDGNLGTDVPAVSPEVIIFQNAKQVTVTSSENIKSVVVYDLLGKVIYVNNNVNAQELITTALPAENQVVIVKAILENRQVINKKVLVD